MSTLNTLCTTYRGYGNSKGKPSEEGTYSDAAAAYRWLTEVKKISAENVIIFGKSLGGSIAAQLATKAAAQALVLENAFTSYIDIGRKFYPYLPVRLFARYSYPTINYIKDIDMPVMIIHSQNDEVVPFELGEKLYEQANEPKEFVKIYGKHNDGFLVSSDLYKKAWTRWLRFLKQSKTQSTHHHAS
ncbi:alpha/beta hydrolase [Planctomycetota bacterium]